MFFVLTVLILFFLWSLPLVLILLILVFQFLLFLTLHFQMVFLGREVHELPPRAGVGVFDAAR